MSLIEKYRSLRPGLKLPIMLGLIALGYAFLVALYYLTKPGQ